jgi:hypothetical protein
MNLADHPIVVCGSPRSGTTFLQATLCSHPDVYITDETRIFNWAHQALGVLPYDKRVYLNHREAFLDELRPSIREMILKLYGRLSLGAHHWGDKEPHYCETPEVLRTIVDLFPATKFIHVIRDGRDVVASIVKRGWLDADAAAEAWVQHVEVAQDFATSLPDAQYLEVRYEELVLEGELVANQVFAFLGLHATPSVRGFLEREKEKRTPFSYPTRKLSRPSRSQFDEAFDGRQRGHIVEILAPTLTRLGYT